MAFFAAKYRLGWITLTGRGAYVEERRRRVISERSVVLDRCRRGGDGTPDTSASCLWAMDRSVASDVDAELGPRRGMSRRRPGRAAGCPVLGDVLPPDLPVPAAAHRRSQYGVRAGIRPVCVQPHGAIGPLYALAGMENSGGRDDVGQDTGVAAHELGSLHGLRP